MESLGEPSVVAEKTLQKSSMTLPTMLATQETYLSPRGRKTMEDKKELDEYPFKSDLEELLRSPVARTMVEECLEEGEIDGSHTLLDSSTTQFGGSLLETPSREIGVTHSIPGSSTSQGGTTNE